MPSFFSGTTAELSQSCPSCRTLTMLLMKPSCALQNAYCFFLHFLVTIPVSLFLGGACFPESPFLPSRNAMDVTVASCLANSRRRQFGRKEVSIDSEHLSLKPFQTTFTRVEMKESSVNFSVNLDNSSSMACLFALFQR